MKYEKNLLERLRKEIAKRLTEKNTLLIEVRPHAKQYDVLSKQEILVLTIKEPAQDNKANEAIVQLLRKAMKKEVKIVQGATSRKKVIRFF